MRLQIGDTYYACGKCNGTNMRFVRLNHQNKAWECCDCDTYVTIHPVDPLRQAIMEALGS
jgi:hypothetical protein